MRRRRTAAAAFLPSGGRPAVIGVPSGRVMRAQHIPCEPSARDGWPLSLISVPGLSVSAVQPVRVSDAAVPSSICHSTGPCAVLSRDVEEGMRVPDQELGHLPATSTDLVAS